MNDEGATTPDDGHGSLLVLAALALVAGAAAGLLGAMFRLALQRADAFRDVVLAAAHTAQLPGLVYVVLVCATATGVAAWLVRRFSPHASGSGIPRVEAVLLGELPPAPLRLIAVKFIGGVLAIGSGLALGREGPSVQIGATIAHVVGQVGRRAWPDCRVLLAAGAGAGLATAFNAPIAGAIFVLEELVRRFEPRIAIAALGASATAIMVSRQFLGNAPDFQVAPLPYPSIATEPLYFALGLAAGALAIVYNRTLLGAIAVADRLAVPVELRAALIGAAVGVLAWFAPDLVGGGDMISQRTLVGAEALAIVPAAFVLRLALGAVSYAAGTPGGLFAPMLVLGAQIGLLFGGASQFAFPTLGIEPTGFAVVGMAALFTGVVRAPLTGIVLATEMTASFTMLLPMLGACFMAMLVPTMLRDPPIYDSLRELTHASEKAAPAPTPKLEAPKPRPEARDNRKRGRRRRRKSGQR
jgi:CIC family chloride channel protein